MKILTISMFMLIANSQCTPIDGVFGTVNDTTSDIKTGIGGMLSYGRSLVFGKNHEEESAREGKPPVPSQGLIDKISMKIHDVSAGVRETVRNVLKITDKDTNENGKGIMKHIYEGVTNKVGKVRGFLFGTTTPKPIEADDATKLKELVDQILANNNSSHEGVKNTYDMLNNILQDARNNMSKAKPHYDGTGMIDIRALDLEGKERNMKEYSDNTINGVITGYDKVEDDVSQAYNRGKQSFDSFGHNVASNINSASNYFKENIDSYARDASNTFGRYTN